MTSQDPAPITTAPSSLTVRAAAGQLRIIPIWQALGQHAAHAKRIRVHCSRKHDFDEMTVTFESVSPAALADITRRLGAQPWIVTASLHTAQTSAPRGDG